jgi:hypothetical protein
VLLPPPFANEKTSMPVDGHYGENLENRVRILYAVYEHSLPETIELGNLNYIRIEEFFIGRLSLGCY